MTDWNGTAWWGQCPHCLLYFDTHRSTCPRVTRAEFTITSNWSVPNTAATNTVLPSGWTFRLTGGAACQP